MFIKFDDGWIKFLRESDKYGEKKLKPLTVLPIDLLCVSGKGQSDSVT